MVLADPLSGELSPRCKDDHACAVSSLRGRRNSSLVLPLQRHRSYSWGCYPQDLNASWRPCLLKFPCWGQDLTWVFGNTDIWFLSFLSPLPNFTSFSHLKYTNSILTTLQVLIHSIINSKLWGPGAHINTIHICNCQTCGVVYPSMMCSLAVSVWK